MKLIITLIAAVVGLTNAASIAFATPLVLNGKESNPNFVVYYPDGPHGIVGEDELHEGEDLVMRGGGSGNFQQWFFGTSASEGLHGEHSLWMEKDPNKDCPDDFILVPQAYPAWGDYLQPGADYCVKTNDFNANNVPGL